VAALQNKNRSLKNVLKSPLHGGATAQDLQCLKRIIELYVPWGKRDGEQRTVALILRESNAAYH
jgi:hypothetical protein